MIDSILNFASAQAAKDDPVLAAHMDQLLAWRGSYVIPNLKVWRVSQDVSGTVNGEPFVRHVYIPGWSLLIALPNAASALLNHANLRVTIDRDRAIARRGGQIIKANVTNTIMQDTRFEPIFMGADYPWGAWT